MLENGMILAGNHNIYYVFSFVVGITGDWKNHFTVALNEKFNIHYEQQMKGSTLKLKIEI